jgi:hypothetical protein
MEFFVYLRLITIFVVLSSSVLVFGGECKEVQLSGRNGWTVHPTRTVVVTIATFASSPPSLGLFKLANEKDRLCCQRLGIVRKSTDPFIHFTVSQEALQSDEIPDAIKQLRALPADCFISDDNFKPQDADIILCTQGTDSIMTLFQLRNEKQQWWLVGYNVKQFFDQFTKKPNYHLSDKNELVQAGIITPDGEWPKKSISIFSFKKCLLVVTIAALFFACAKSVLKHIS